MNVLGRGECSGRVLDHLHSPGECCPEVVARELPLVPFVAGVLSQLKTEVVERAHVDVPLGCSLMREENLRFFSVLNLMIRWPDPAPVDRRLDASCDDGMRSEPSTRNPA